MFNKQTFTLSEVGWKAVEMPGGELQHFIQSRFKVLASHRLLVVQCLLLFDQQIVLALLRTQELVRGH